MKHIRPLLLLPFLFIIVLSVRAQRNYKWTKDGNGYYDYQQGEMVKISLPTLAKTVIAAKNTLTPPGQSNGIAVQDFSFSADERKILIYTNSQKVWRYNTRGDYWVLDLDNNTLKQLGHSRPASSLMFAKFSPDGTKVAYVSAYNLYVEDIATGQISQLTFDGNRKLINGTFDWAYEEEFFCRDGFRWSPDSKQIAYWQIDAKGVKDYLMINNTDSIYPFVKPVEYPVAGEPPSPFKIGVVDITLAQTKWMAIPTDPVLQSYVPRMEWAANSHELIVQHLNRKQNQSNILLCDAKTGNTKNILEEKDTAWIDVIALWDQDYANGGWDWLNNGKEFLWASEKDGWRHLYRISRDGKKQTLITV